MALACASPVRAANEITWAIFDSPPDFILDGEPALNRLGDGSSDRLLALLADALPGYHHRLEKMVVKRILAEFAAGRPVCMLNGAKTPDRDAIAYATPVLIAPSLQLVFSKQSLAKLPNASNGVRLAELVKRQDINGQYQAGRSYGDRLDTIIRHTSNAGLRANETATTVASLRMLALNRADYTVEYPMVLHYLEAKGEAPQGLVSVPILDADQFMTGYVLCSRNGWGFKVIQDIDTALQRLAKQPAYQQAIEHWLPEEELRRHRADYDRFYRERSSRRLAPSKP